MISSTRSRYAWAATSLSLISVSLIAGIGITLVGCSHQSDGVPQGASFAVAASTTLTSTGPYPRGQVTSKTQLSPANLGPRITVISPERGAQISSSTTTVNVTVEVDTPNTVASVSIAGTPATNSSGSQYTAPVTLTLGTNFITVTATDNLGQQGTGCFTLVSGTFETLTNYLPSCVSASVTPPALAQAAAFIDSETQTLNLSSLVTQVNPVFSAVGFAANVTGFTYDPPQFTLSGEPGGLQITLQLNQPNVPLQVTAFGASVAQVNMTADSLTADIEAVPNTTPAFVALSPNNAFGLQILTVMVSFQNLQFSSPSSVVQGLLTTFQAPLTQAITNELQSALQSELQKAFDQVTLPGIGTPLTIPVPTPSGGTAPLDLLFQIDQAGGSPQIGLAVALGLQLNAVQLPTPTNGLTDQVLVSGVQPPVGITTQGNFAAYANEDGINAFAQAYWLSGGLEYTINQATVTSSLLEARTLYPFFPQVTELAPNPNTPIGFTISSGSPPTVTFSANGTITATAGEAQVLVFIDYQDGQPPLDLFTVRIPCQVTANLQIVNNAIVIANCAAPVVYTDVISEPVTPLQDLAIDQFLQQLLPFVLNQFKSQIPPIPIPGLPYGFQLTNPNVASGDHYLAVWGDL